MRLPSSYRVESVDQVARNLVQLEALPQRGFVEDMEGLFVKASEVCVE